MLAGICKWFVDGVQEIRELFADKTAGSGPAVVDNAEQWRQLANVMVGAIATHGDGATRARARAAVAHLAALQAAQDGQLGPIVEMSAIADGM